jgi:hypothetical protein
MCDFVRASRLAAITYSSTSTSWQGPLPSQLFSLPAFCVLPCLPCPPTSPFPPLSPFCHSTFPLPSPFSPAIYQANHSHPLTASTKHTYHFPACPLHTLITKKKIQFNRPWVLHEPKERPHNSKASVHWITKPPSLSCCKRAVVMCGLCRFVVSPPLGVALSRTDSP